MWSPMDGLQKPPIGHPHYSPEEIKAAKPKEETEMGAAAAAKYRELKRKIADAKKQMEQTAKDAFSEMSADFFAENPKIVSFGWTQYTPYWNDGDECVFSANTDYPTVSIMVDGDTVGYDSNQGDLLVNGNEVETSDQLVRTFKDLGVESFIRNGKEYTFDSKKGTVLANGVPLKTREAYRDMFDPYEKKVSSFMGNFEDEDLKVMFGDHITVTVNRDGVEIEDYEHD